MYFLKCVTSNRFWLLAKLKILVIKCVGKKYKPYRPLKQNSSFFSSVSYFIPLAYQNYYERFKINEFSQTTFYFSSHNLQFEPKVLSTQQNLLSM